MNLIRVERTPAASLSEPFGLMRNMLRWDPFRDLETAWETPRSFLPAFDIRETPEAYLFTADLPGMRQEDLEIQLTGTRLTVSGKREAQPRQAQETWFAQERTFGSFTRTFTLPEGIDGNAIKADLQQGVLTLSIPKVPDVQPRRIAISTGN